MLWAIYLTDKPDATALRAKHLEPHKAYLHKVDSQIFFTGPLQSDDATKNIGSLWIINAGSRAEAQAFSDGEAYTRAGVFSSVTITRARKDILHPELAD